MLHRSLRPYYVMGTLIAALLVVTAGAGVLVNGSLYTPFLGDNLAAFQVIQDVVSLAFAPHLVAAMVFTGRGSLRAFILWNALLVYVVYYYAYYGFGMVYTVYYPLYLALMAMAAFSLVGLLTGIDLGAFRRCVGDRMPVRYLGIVLGIPLLLGPLWVAMMMQDIAAHRVQPTALVFVLDLSFLLPAVGYAAVQIWRRRPIGLLLGGVLLIKAAVSGVLLGAGEIQHLVKGLPVATEQLAMWVFLAGAGTVGLVLYMRNLRGGLDGLGLPEGSMGGSRAQKPGLSH